MVKVTCAPICDPNTAESMPDNTPDPLIPPIQGLPDGGDPGEFLGINDEGVPEWMEAPGGGGSGLPPGGEPGQTIINNGDGTGEWGDIPPGPEGPEGPEGPQGTQGVQGPEGPMGPAGDPGPTGPEGPQGVPGADGEVGIAGPIGPQGLVGPPFQVDEYGNLDEAKIAEIELADVNWYFVVNPLGDDRTNTLDPPGMDYDLERHLLFFDATTDTWFDYGVFTGIAGPQGPQGPQGEQGNPGPQGIQGVIGPAGAQGETGAPGPQGIAGPQGIQGVPGATGPAGLSAYAIDVANGFVGTVEEWLESLIGPQGTTTPSYDITILHDTLVAAGLYNLTIYQPIAWTYTKLTHVTAQGTVGNLRLRKNGTIVATIATVDTSRDTATISVAVAVGDILALELTTTTGVRSVSVSLS